MTQPKRKRRSVPRPTNGGARAGAGRPANPTRETGILKLSAAALSELRVIVAEQRGVRNNPALTQRQIIEELIHREWLSFNEYIDQIVEDAGDDIE